MKQHLICLISLILLVACSSDDEKEITPTGNYVAFTDGVVLSVEIKNGSCNRITAFNANKVVSQYVAITTTGQYPNFTYQGEDITLVCTFENADQFDAIVTGSLPNNILGGNGFTDVTGHYHFTRFEGMLDANGDGIID